MKIGEIAAFIITISVFKTEGLPIPSPDSHSIISTAEKGANSDERHSETIFEAYWCGDPSNVQNAGFVNDPQCISHAKVANTEEAVYQLVHEIKHQKVKGFTCQVSITRIARYCGVYDHQTSFTPYNQYDVPVSISATTCQDWHSRFIYEDSAGKAHPLKEDTINIVRFEAMGNTYVAPGSGEVSCNGQDLKWENEIIHNILVEVQVRITLKKEEFRIRGKKVNAYFDNVALHCSADQNSCQSATTTYLWEKPDPCILAYEKDVRGVEVTSDRGDKVFVSTDLSLVRLIKKEPLSICNRVVYRTNYDGIYLYAYGQDPFTLRVDPDDVSITTYINNRDDYLFNHIADAMEEELRGVLSDDCSTQSQKIRVDFWLQHQDPDLTSWIVGNGVFATTAGEVIYQYQCPAVKVKAMLMERCYQSLPVKVLGSLGKEEESLQRQWFMEPLTRKLTTNGLEMPCSTVFRPKYRNLNGNWMEATPEIHAAAAPTLPNDNLSYTRKIFADRPEFGRGGGVYKDQTLKDFETYQEYKRTIVTLQHTMVNQADPSWRYEQGNILRPEMLFTELKDPRKWASNIWAKARGFLHTFGEISAIFVAVFTIYRVVTNLLKWAVNVIMLKDVYGCTSQLCWFPCINLFLLRQYQRANKYDLPEEKPVDRPTFKKAKNTQPSRTGEDDERNGYIAPLQVEPKIAGGALGVPQQQESSNPGYPESQTPKTSIWPVLR